MQQSCTFMFIFFVSFFLVLLTTLTISAIVSEIKMEKMLDQFIKEMENKN